jgi:hypothetical protein
VDKNEMLKKIIEDEDFIRCPKVGNSLNRFTQKNYEGVDNAVIARLLMMSEDEVEKNFQETIALLRKDMVDEES